MDTAYFRLISNCSVAREAWIALQVQGEGTTSVGKTRMRILTIKFENLRVLEDETIGSYYDKVATMENKAQALGDPSSNE